MSGGVPKRISISRTQSNTPSKAGNVMAKKAIVLCNGARSRRAMCNSVQTRAKYCPTPCKTDSSCQEGPAISFTGATVSTIPGFTVLTFNSSGTFTIPPNFGKSVEYLVVGGGGSGGAGNLEAGGVTTYGGGGGGESRAGTFTPSFPSSQLYTVTVGTGSPGLGSSAQAFAVAQGGVLPWNSGVPPAFRDASNSSIKLGPTTIADASGGFNGQIPFIDPSGGGLTSTRSTAGGAGGSGGGTGAPGFLPSGSVNLYYGFGGGGGGGTSAGQAPPSLNNGGDGGLGFLSSITGTAKRYGGGGGGAGGATGTAAGGDGGLGGGGRGVGALQDGSANLIGSQAPGGLPIPPAVNGTPNTGGGGGGVSPNDSANTFNSGAGGSGVVIIRYATDC